ncbi:unnamed protein product [Oncorhynchus mykiss]|uniref:Uncharacterized protein n=1 Tax=Oncorhynchus mykiss TaxID=8022 RepID=A0A060YWB2_ONCMY|nr:unnamed protein product [Oncorhynchus mykiss]
MSVPVHPETRKFTRGLSKPGTAAELRQSVSEVVRTSVFIVSTPFPYLLPLRNLSLFSIIHPSATVPCVLLLCSPSRCHPTSPCVSRVLTGGQLVERSYSTCVPIRSEFHFV